jgi:hypothetical protein
MLVTAMWERYFTSSVSDGRGRADSDFRANVRGPLTRGEFTTALLTDECVPIVVPPCLIPLGEGLGAASRPNLTALLTSHGSGSNVWIRYDEGALTSNTAANSPSNRSNLKR